MRLSFRVVPHRALSILLASALAFAACDESDPSGPGGTLPETLAPVSVTTEKNTAITATVRVSSTAGRDLDVEILSGPSHGTADVSPQSGGLRVQYTPAQGFAGEDEVRFRVDDGRSTVDGVVRITVLNQAPSASPLTLRRPATAAVTFTLTGSDADREVLTFQLVDGPAGGELTGIASGAGTPGTLDASGATSTLEVTYTPAPGSIGDDSFTFRVFDGAEASAPVTVHLPANRLPEVVVERGLPVPVGRNAPTRVFFTMVDEDGDAVTATVGEEAREGTLGGVERIGGRWGVLYTPAEGFIGDDAFTLILDDGFDTTEIEIPIEVANAAPAAYNAATFGFLGSDVQITLTGGDPDGDPLTFEVVTPPSSGSVSEPVSVTPITAQVVFTPDETTTAGPVTFTYRVTDGITYSGVATATIHMRNTAPRARSTSATVEAGSSVDIVLTGTDQQGDSLRFAIVTAPSHGTLGPIVPLGPSTARVTYTPAPGHEGADLFTFTVSDGEHVSDPATVAITVTAAPDTPPVVVDLPVEDFVTHGNVPLEVAAVRTAPRAVHVTGTLLDNFIDLDGDGLTASLAPGSVSAGATVVVHPDGTFIYEPPAGQTADDTFDYVVTDGTTPITRTVTITFDTPIWFVDGAASGPSEGTAGAPFLTLAEAAAASGPGEIIVVAPGNTATTPLDGGFTFQSEQQLIGEQEGVVTSRGTIIAPTAGAAPVITHSAGDALTLAPRAVVRGITVEGAAGAAIAGAGVDGSTIERATLRDVGGAAIDLDTPSGTWTFTEVTVVDPAGGGFHLDGGTATIEAALAMETSAGPSIRIQGVTGGSVTFTGSLDAGGEGIRVTGNSGGTFTFAQTTLDVRPVPTIPGVVLDNNDGATLAFTGGALDVATEGATALLATGGGVLTITGDDNRVVADQARAIRVLDTALGAEGLRFREVTAADADYGILVENAGVGPFEITGDASPGSGGTIANMSGDGALFRGTGPVRLQAMVIGDGSVEPGDPPTAASTIGGAGVRAEGLEPGAVLQVMDMHIADTGEAGIAVADVDHVIVHSSSIMDNAGWGVDFGIDGLDGTAEIVSTTIDGFITGGIRLEQTEGAPTLVLDLSEVVNSQDEAPGLLLRASGSATPRVEVGNMTSIRNVDGSAISIEVVDDARLDLEVEDGLFDGSNAPLGAILADVQGAGELRASIHRTTIMNASGSAVMVDQGAASTGIVEVTIDELEVGDGAAGSGTGADRVGLALLNWGSGSTTAQVTDSRFRNHGVGGIFSFNAGTGAPGSQITLVGNEVSPPETEDRPAIRIQSAAERVVCVDVRENEVVGSGTAVGILVEQLSTSIFRYVEPGTSTSIVDWLEAGNPPSSASSTGDFTPVASCQ